ncbi:DUF3813 domain-containing protein [Pseudalkalibacillus caeni]|uniref:DUF3813 domain-containing protein n=1 Tax=Exobacillus caeni TaxID=2574798 RepID=A0A5R9F5T3_9BACL|nr:DUF3813 domain-containing protein [Pseudalkalibacillus caeni]TLS37849.1 DUF3813 domain-containing protein [Pseudalkalibacillus caeni]
MANVKFQLAREAVDKAEQLVKEDVSVESAEAIANQLAIAKNNLSLAFAHSSDAEKVQLEDYQQTLEELSDHFSNKPF